MTWTSIRRRASDNITKWQIADSEVAFPFASGPEAARRRQTRSHGEQQQRQRRWQHERQLAAFSENIGPNGWGVCPAAAMKLTTQKASDRSSFNAYINSLQPVGGTYHDAGMV